MTPAVRRAAGTLLLALGGACWALPATAACIPLSGTAYSDLDQLVEADPEHGITSAESLLESSPEPLPTLARAELYAILAQGRSDEGRSSDAHAAVLESRRLLDTLPASAARERLHARLDIADHINAESRVALAEGVRVLGERLERFQQPSIERSCLLSARAELHAENLALDSAASDAIAAYQLAATGHWEGARATAAGALATVYRRSGLPAEAVQKIDESLAYYRSRGALSQVATLAYDRGQALDDLCRYDDALAAFESARRSSIELRDHLGVAVAQLPMCATLIELWRFDAAEAACSGLEDEFRRADRRDLVATLLGYRAEIDLARHNPTQALAKLDELYGDYGEELPPALSARFRNDRSRTLTALGRDREASIDARLATSTVAAVESERRTRAVAVLRVTAEAEQLAAHNRELQGRVALQDAELKVHRQVRTLGFGLVAAAIALTALLGAMLAQSRRHGQAMRRQSAVLRAAASHAPDALMLVSRHGQVLYSNRPLLGVPAAASQGTDLDSNLSPDNRFAIRAAFERAIESKSTETIEVIVGGTSGPQYFELLAAPVIEDGEAVGAVLRSLDVTTLRRIESEVIDVASRERQRLSEDLHEGLGQTLTGVALLARTLEGSLRPGLPDEGAMAGDIAAHVNDAISQTRDIARGLSPVQIERGLLSAALNRLGREARERLGFEVTTRCEPADIEMPAAFSDHLYRIVQEALGDAARGGVGLVEVALVREGDAVTLEIRECGGAHRNRGDRSGALGPKIMQYRARRVGGTFLFETGADGGCHIRVVVPLPPDWIQSRDRGPASA
jgi:signal transduction histidine kinase